jgi:hypothetical protein
MKPARLVRTTIGTLSLLAVTSGVVITTAPPAGAVPAGWVTAPGGTNSSGAGFCISQVAQDPAGTVGAPNLGLVTRELALSDAGAVPAAFATLRYPLCGGPGSGA